MTTETQIEMSPEEYALGWFYKRFGNLTPEQVVEIKDDLDKFIAGHKEDTDDN